jgi:uncharacterized protein
MNKQTENKQLLTTIFDALATGDTRPFTEAMADELRWSFAGEWSWARDWGASKREVRDNLLRPLMEQYRDYRSSAEEILADGDRVVVRARATATTVRGEAYAQAYCYVFGVIDGRITEVIEYCDTALVERVLELPAGPSP